MVKLYKFHGGKWDEDINGAANSTRNLDLIIDTLIKHPDHLPEPVEVKDNSIKAFSDEEIKRCHKKFFG